MVRRLTSRRHRSRRPRSNERGLTLVEVLISLGILTLAIVGIIPLFMRSMQSNALGRHYTQSAQVATARLEEFYTLPLDRTTLTIPSGSTTLVNDRFWVVNRAYPLNGGYWKTTAPTATEELHYSANATLRQYSVADIESSYQVVTPLDGNTPLPHVHLRELVLTVNHPRPAGSVSGILLPVRNLQLSALRAF
jgi:Tfp pilus assembly protein PilV